MDRSPRVPPVVAGLVIVLSFGFALWLVSGSGPPRQPRERPAPTQATGPPAEVARPARIATRLEALRRLEFDRVPRVRILTSAEWRRRTGKAAESGASGEREKREVEAVEDFLKLSGLATADFDAEQATEGVGELIGGFYRPKANRLVLVEQPFQGIRGQERVIAHELEHALQNQHYPKALRLGAATGEREVALSALVEGDASVVERRYARRHLDLPTQSAEKSLLSPANLAVGLPPALVASVRFPYTAGADFVAALRRRGGWELVDEAFRDPPTTSEQILHPGKYLAGEGAERVSSPPASVLGPAWRTVAKVESGELDAIVILASGVPSDVAQRGAKGWQGGSFEALVLPGGGEGCAGVCRARRAAVVVYRWETLADAAEFTVAAGRYLSIRLSEGRRRGSTFPIGDAAAALAFERRTTSIAYAPSEALARRLAGAALADTR